MNNRISLRPSILVATSLLILWSLGGCKDFFGTEDLKEAIRQDAALATAPEITFMVSADPPAAGNLSVFGSVIRKVGESFSITATPSRDYAFSGWTAVGGGNVSFSSVSASTTTVKIGNQAPDIEVFANFASRPNIWPNGDYNPVGTNVLLNQVIYAQFSKTIDQETLNEGTISITSKPVGVLDAPSISIWSDFDLVTAERGFTLTPRGAMDTNQRITVTVSRQVTDAGGIAMADDFSWYFSTGSESDTSVPTFSGDITVEKGHTITIPAVRLAGGEFAVDRGDITIRLVGNSNSGTVQVTAIRITETDLDSTDSTTNWYGYSSARTYQLQTSGTGIKSLAILLQNSNGLISGPQTVSVYLDTVAPVVAGITLGSGAAYTGTLTPALAIGAITETGSGIGGYAVTGSAAEPAAGVWSDTAPTTATLSVGDGSKSVYLHVRDNAGNRGYASSTITLDRTPPDILGAFTFSSGTTETLAGVAIDALAVNDAALMAYIVSVSSTAPVYSVDDWTAISGTTWNPVAVNLAADTPNGPHRFHLYVRDIAGNVSSATASADLTVNAGGEP